MTEWLGRLEMQKKQTDADAAGEPAAKVDAAEVSAAEPDATVDADVSAEVDGEMQGTAEPPAQLSSEAEAEPWSMHNTWHVPCFLKVCFG